MLIVMTRVNKMMHDSLDILSRSHLNVGEVRTRPTAIRTLDGMLAVSAFAIDVESNEPVKGPNWPVLANTRSKMAMMGVEYDVSGFYKVAIRPFGGLKGVHIAGQQIPFRDLAGRLEITFAPTSLHEFPWTEVEFYSARNPQKKVELKNNASMNEDSVIMMAPLLDAFVSDQLKGPCSP